MNTPAFDDADDAIHRHFHATSPTNGRAPSDARVHAWLAELESVPDTLPSGNVP